ncbi:MAG TPA: glycoside hydrolase family 3 C-terminal domain-containing protein, partial [Terracidiphilus sp.]
DGFVVSDWGSVGELLNHAIGDGPTVARKALEAGVEMDMEGNLYGTTLAAQVRSGKIPESVIDEAARRVLRVKFALGLFDHPFTQPGAPYEPTADLRARTRKVADETIVLLKNDAIEAAGTLLPLKDKKTVALIGPMADDKPDMLGAWAAGDPKYVITLRQALEEKLGADHLVYAQGCGLLNGQDAEIWSKNGGPQPIADENATIAEAVEAAKKADIAILALGEPAGFMEGEAGSRTTLGFTGSQQKLLEEVVATGKPVILVVAAGRPLEIKWAAEHVPAILEAWNPGFEGGHALTDILFGDVNPSAKLPASLPRAVGQEPLYYAQMPTGRPARNADLTHMPANSEEKYLSRYVDEQNSALFPFGWGLSYTRFAYSTPTVDRETIPVNEVMSGSHKPVVKVGVDVRNTGSVAGTEVVQLYIRIPNVSVEEPLRELKGFTRVTLQPGESKHVEFPLGFDEMNFYNVDLKQVVEPTTYDVWVGGSSLADAHTTFKVVE